MMRKIIEHSHGHPLKNQKILLRNEYPCATCSQSKLIVRLREIPQCTEYCSATDLTKNLWKPLPLDHLRSSKGIINQKLRVQASYTFKDLSLKMICSLTRNEPSPRFVSRNSINLNDINA